MIYLNDFIALLEVNNTLMNPCTAEDINKIEKIVGDKKLPIAYVEFLNSMGRGTTFFRGEDCFMDELLELNEWGKLTLEESKVPLKITDNDFVFWMSQGCAFCFFKLNEGENPPVYFFSQYKKHEGFYKITDTFTEFLFRKFDYDRHLFEKKT